MKDIANSTRNWRKKHLRAQKYHMLNIDNKQHLQVLLTCQQSGPGAAQGLYL